MTAGPDPTPGSPALQGGACSPPHSHPGHRGAAGRAHPPPGPLCFRSTSRRYSSSSRSVSAVNGLGPAVLTMTCGWYSFSMMALEAVTSSPCGRRGTLGLQEPCPSGTRSLFPSQAQPGQGRQTAPRHGRATAGARLSCSPARVGAGRHEADPAGLKDPRAVLRFLRRRRQSAGRAQSTSRRVPCPDGDGRGDCAGQRPPRIRKRHR